MATISLHPPLKSRDRHEGASFANTTTSPKHDTRQHNHHHHHHHHRPLPTSTNCPTSPYHKPTSPHQRSTSPYRRSTSPYSVTNGPMLNTPHQRPVSPYSTSNNPHQRPTSPYSTSNNPHQRPTSPYSMSNNPHQRPTSPYNRSTSPLQRPTTSPSVSPHLPVSPSSRIDTSFLFGPSVNPSSPEHLTTAEPSHPTTTRFPSNHSSSSKNLQCALCIKEYQDARILPCFHTFCAQCLETACVNKGEDKMDSIYCPICMDVSELTNKGVQGLPKNTYVEQLQVLRRSPPPRLNCDLCIGSEVAVKRCEKCNCNLCDFCIHAHQKQRKTSTHRLVGVLEHDGSSSRDHEGGVGSLEATRKPVRCKAHTERESVLYCENCKVPVCDECALKDHRDHHLLQMDDANRQYSEVLLSLLARAKPLAASLNESVKNIDFVVSNIQERSRVVSEEIIESISCHVRALQEHKRSLLMQLDAIKKQKEGTLKNQVTTLRELLEELNLNYSVASKSLMDENPLVAFSSKMPAASKLEELLSAKQDTSPKEDDYIQFHSDVPARDINDFHMFGTLDSRGPSAANTTAEGEGLYKAREGKSSEFKVIVYDRYKQRREFGRDKIEANMIDGENEGVYMSVKDCEDGSYLISYTPDYVGEHRLSVLVEGKNIRGSPFAVSVSPRLSHHHGTFHCCTFCSSEGKKHIRCGCGGTMPGGYSGCGHGHHGHPGRRHWSCCGSTIEKSECQYKTV